MITEKICWQAEDRLPTTSQSIPTLHGNLPLFNKYLGEFCHQKCYIYINFRFRKTSATTELAVAVKNNYNQSVSGSFLALKTPQNLKI